MEKFIVSYDFLILYTVLSMAVGVIAGVIIGIIVKGRKMEICEIKLQKCEEELSRIKEEERQYARFTNDC